MGLQIGSKIKDNDPRMTNRYLEVVEILPNKVAAKNFRGQVFLILLRRIHTDGKKRRSGFDLVP